jgi:transposase
MEDTQIGYNSSGSYDPQVNLLYAFLGGETGGMPAYYRKFPGSVRDVSAFLSFLTETGIKDAVVIADKGFGSAVNFKELDAAGLKYIVPLRRNNQLYDRSPLTAADKSGFDGAFSYNDRPIWHYLRDDGEGHSLAVFLDGSLRLQEEKDYMRRLFARHEGYDEEGLRARQLEFGTIVLKTSLSESAERIYHLYKKRMQIEQMFDDYKNLMDLDTCYLQSDAAMEAWLFLNHLGMMACYRVFELLRATGSLKKYSMKGVLQEYLSGVRAERLTGNWRYEVMTKGNRVLIDQLGLKMPETPILKFE